MKPVKVESSSANACGCMQDPICACRQVQTVEPEIKTPICACAGLPSCGCSSAGQQLTVTQDACGCMHLAVCPCKPTYVQPEVREAHLAPELKDSALPTSCGCVQDPVCACRKIETVTPEIREPKCACPNTQVLACACSAVSR
jgi:hypothetical protein